MSLFTNYSNQILFLYHKNILRIMEVIIQQPCNCILDNEPHISDLRINPLANRKTGKYHLDIKDNVYTVMKGDDEEISFDRIQVKIVDIKVPDVDVTLHRSSCNERVIIKVCKGSNVWLEGFDDVFPRIDIYCRGKVSSISERSFVVDKLRIFMNPDYSNDSAIIGFQVKSSIIIHYQYNGIVNGNVEENCTIRKPDNICMGRSAKIMIKHLSQGDQNKIQKMRETHAYEILSNQYNSDLISDVKGICCVCGLNKVKFSLVHCKHEMCVECVYHHANKYDNHLNAPYFICPVYSCKKSVYDLKTIHR